MIEGRALAVLLEGIVETVKACGDGGVPGGVLYAALMNLGCSLQLFEQIMDTLVKFGKLEKRGQLYFARRGN